MTAAEAVLDAVENTPFEHYLLGRDGVLFRHRTSVDAICRHLRLLDVRPGMSVLEIGTGSGLSGALLARLAGADGRVVSLDILPEVTERAAELHRWARPGPVATMTADGRDGFPANAPYDRIIAWATPRMIPEQWVRQTRPGGVVVHPVLTAPVLHSTAMVRFTVTGEQTPADATLHYGQYGGLRTAAEAVTPAGGGRPREAPRQITAPWLTRAADADASAAVLRRIVEAGYREAVPTPWPLTEHLKLWLMACNPPGLTAAAFDFATAVGITTPDHLALIVVFPEPCVIADGRDSPALAELRGLMAAWEARGRPGIDTLTPSLVRRRGAWSVHLESPMASA